MIIRPASREDGPAIGTLFAEEGDCPTMDWTRPGIEAWWLVASEAEEVIAAMQILCALPTGYIGDIVVATAHRRTGVARALWKVAEELMRRAGCQRVAATLRGRAWWVQAVIDTEGFALHDGPVVVVSKEIGP